MMDQVTKIIFWLECLLLPLASLGQSYMVDPASIHLEATASNWQTTVISGFVLSGNYGLVWYRIEIPPVEVGMPRQLGPENDRRWIMQRDAAKVIGWAADRAAYQCAQRFIDNRAYYANRARVIADFKRDMTTLIQLKIPGARVLYEGPHTPPVERSEVRFLVVPFDVYLAHLGVGE